VSRQNVFVVLVLIGISFVFLACPAQAVKDWRQNEWAVVIEVSPGVHLCLYNLDDRADEFRPCNLNGSSKKQKVVERMELPKFFSEDGHYDSDYVYGAVYIEGDSKWVLTENTRIVLSYQNTETGAVIRVVSQDILFTLTNRAAETQKLFNPNDQIVVLLANSRLDRTAKTDGIIVLVRFPSRSLPRGSQFKWKPPDNAEVREVKDGEPVPLSEGR
jgi:hypothetical protein